MGLYTTQTKYLNNKLRINFPWPLPFNAILIVLSMSNDITDIHDKRIVMSCTIRHQPQTYGVFQLLSSVLSTDCFVIIYATDNLHLMLHGGTYCHSNFLATYYFSSQFYKYLVWVLQLYSCHCSYDICSCVVIIVCCMYLYYIRMSQLCNNLTIVCNLYLYVCCIHLALFMYSYYML